MSLDWKALGQEEAVLKWLEHAATEYRTREVKLDPFATSMRNFDDVSPNLKAIVNGQDIAVNDTQQRLADLKSAGIVATDNTSLTHLGMATYSGWEANDVDSGDLKDEFARLLILVIEAQRIADTRYTGFFDYWKDLRANFDPIDLIDNWDALYTLSYLDVERDGFRPGDAFRTSKAQPKEIQCNIIEFAKASGASKQALYGAEKVSNAIAGKVPRGRYRASFCMALELVVSEGGSKEQILDAFGKPIRPGEWEKFDPSHKARVDAILDSYVVLDKEKNVENISDKAGKELAATTAVKELLSNIDFSSVMTDPPTKKVEKPAEAKKASGKKKTDYQKKQKENDETGQLGELFALEFEKWRLMEHPGYLEKIEHVSLEDDTLGYDIVSFEEDGSERLVEVKSTLSGLDTRFFMSANELECAKANPKNYVILRVANLSSKPVCCELRPPFDSLNIIPESYIVKFK